MTRDRAYDADPLGQLDAGTHEPIEKGCLKRIDHENVSRFETSVTWCTLPQGHDGQCSGPLPTILDGRGNYFGPRKP